MLNQHTRFVKLGELVPGDMCTYRPKRQCTQDSWVFIEVVDINSVSLFTSQFGTVIASCDARSLDTSGVSRGGVGSTSAEFDSLMSNSRAVTIKSWSQTGKLHVAVGPPETPVGLITVP